MKPIIIPNFSRRKEFIEMLAKRKANFGAEIGTDHGVYAQQLCYGIPNLHLICVDPWTSYTEGDEFHSQEEMDKIYEEATTRLSVYDTRIIRKTSKDAYLEVPDNSLDFVFIDANHEYENVLNDIRWWSRSVKSGGIVAGHDYKADSTRKYGVVEAVQKYVIDNNIAPLFILQKRGLVDCWMFFKQ